MINKLYKINEGKVVSETLDGETIIINLDNGNYYSTNVTGAAIWNLIQSNNNTEDILKYFINHYDVSSDIAEKSVSDILEFLLKENLILESELNLSERVSKTEDSIKKEPFVDPKIEKYEDMQEMLFADPIHDVDEKDGWPVLK